MLIKVYIFGKRITRESVYGIGIYCKSCIFVKFIKTLILAPNWLECALKCYFKQKLLKIGIHHALALHKALVNILSNFDKVWLRGSFAIIF